MKLRLIKDWKKHLRSYSALSLFANLLIALSYGLSISFGMGLVYLSPFWIVTIMGIVAGLGSLGKFVKQFDEEKEEDRKT